MERPPFATSGEFAVEFGGERFVGQFEVQVNRLLPEPLLHEVGDPVDDPGHVLAVVLGFHRPGEIQ